MNIILKESQIKNIFLPLITEGDSRLRKLDALIRQTFDGWGINFEGKVNSPTFYINNDPNTTWMEYMIYNFRHEFELMNNSDVKYLFDFARIAFGELGWETDDADINGLKKLKEASILIKKHPELFEKGIKGKSAQEFLNFFTPIIEKIHKEEDNKVNGIQYKDGANDYDIVPCPDYKTARMYGMQSCPESILCYAEKPHVWETYTNKGKNKVYILLKQGWQNIPCEHTKDLIGSGIIKDSAYDEYGLSMIFIFVDSEKNLTCCNTRWNHRAIYKNKCSVDHALDKVDISLLINKNFNTAFVFPSRQMKELN